jgi:cysteinyl-tRNA synthetase
MPLRIYNSLTGAKEPFTPGTVGKVGMYVCGVTVYDRCHIGHARAYIVFDVIRNYLEHSGYAVTYVQNITDVDDKIIERANAEGITVDELTARTIKGYFEDMEGLGVRPADLYPRATEHIPEMIALIAELIGKGKAYQAGGDVLFDVAVFPTYGRLSGREGEESVKVSRLGENSAKRNPGDFVLWKAAKEGEPFWESPWGNGRPGWHIECSAMSMKYLGVTLDIHGGGLDLKFPHHENEIAQSEASTGQPFARYWIHNGFVNVSGQKMSKSLGNVVSIRDALGRYSAAVIRLFFLGTHYRSTVDFSFEKLEQAAVAYRRVTATLQALREAVSASPGDAWPARPAREEALRSEVASAKAGFTAGMDDDCNTPEALAALHRLLREANGYYHEEVVAPGRKPDLACQGLLAEVVACWESSAALLGLDLSFSGRGDAGGQEEALIGLLVEVRERLRKAKAWELSDLVRDKLAAMGFVLEDLPGGTVVKRSTPSVPLAT